LLEASVEPTQGSMGLGVKFGLDGWCTAETVIDKIYAVYGGQTSLTKIINGLKRDKKDATLNPNFGT
jgi:hypothetical protein